MQNRAPLADRKSVHYTQKYITRKINPKFKKSDSEFICPRINLLYQRRPNLKLTKFRYDNMQATYAHIKKSAANEGLVLVKDANSTYKWQLP